MILDLDSNSHYRHEFASFPGSYALISPLEKVECSIVFVHGYGGDPYGTWTNFQFLIDEHYPCADSYQGADLFFFRYESKDEWIHASTDRLLNFIDQVILDPNQDHFVENTSPIVVGASILTSATLPVSVLPSPRRYSRLILVGHSEGGVVIRNAIIKWFKSKKTKNGSPPKWKLLMQSQLSLFAPAIAGFRPSGFLGVAMRLPWLGNILDAALSNDAGYQDLSDPEFLQNLREQTEDAAKRNPHKALRADIVWGYRDRIVHPTKYNDDTEQFVDKDHINICKPRDDYGHPIEFVASGLVEQGETISQEEYTE
jgi:hypothetical protein